MTRLAANIKARAPRDVIVYRMVRRGQQSQQQVRKAQRRVTESLGTDQGSYQAPDRGECTEKQWEMPCDDANTVRLQFLIWRRAGRLVDFVVNVHVLAADGWEVLEYFDCCHGSYHLHAKSGEEPRTIARLDDVDDVERAFAQVEQEARDRARIIQG